MNTLPGGLSLILHLIIIVIGWIRDQAKKLWAKIQWIFFRKPDYGPVAHYAMMLGKPPTPPSPFGRSSKRYLAFSLIAVIALTTSILGWKLAAEAFSGPTNASYVFTALHLGK